MLVLHCEGLSCQNTEIIADQTKKIDYMLIECNRLANPEPIADIFLLNGAVEPPL